MRINFQEKKSHHTTIFIYEFMAFPGDQEQAEFHKSSLRWVSSTIHNRLRPSQRFKLMYLYHF